MIVVSTDHINLMIRQIKFDDVSNYEVVYSGSDLALKIFQPDNVETIVNVAVGNMADLAEKLQKAATSIQPQKKRQPKTIDLTDTVTSTKPVQTKLQEADVKYIKGAFTEMVEVTGSETAAAKLLAKHYKCSYQNILAIMSGRSWKHVKGDVQIKDQQTV